MPDRPRNSVVAIGAALLMGWWLVLPAVAAGQGPSPAPGKDAPVVADFVTRVNAYVTVHLLAERAAPKLPEEATPQQIDQTQRAMASRILAARAGAKRGDIFTPEMAALVRRVLLEVLSGPEGARRRASIMDDNVKFLPLTANQRYPDDVPLTTMPPGLLMALPELPEEMEYRFIGPHLVLFDQHAHIIPDFIPDALPRK
jgi:hypothetical protein